MKIPLKAKAICKDGEYGSVKELLIDPVKEKVTHIVLENKHNGLQVIIPLSDIDYSTDNVITVEKTGEEVDKYPKFILHEFINLPISESEYTYWGADPTMTNSYTMFPYVMHEGKPVVEVAKEAIPEGELKLKKGMVVKDFNGKHLGHIDELIVDSKSDFITHLVMRSGHAFGKREVAVPNIDILSFEKTSVILSITEEEIEKLPEVVIKRAWK